MRADIHLTDLDPDEQEAIIHAKENAEWRERVEKSAKHAWRLDGDEVIPTTFIELLHEIGVDAKD